MCASAPIQPAAEREFNDIKVGDSFELSHTFDTPDVLQFAAVSGDFSPVHVDATYAATTEFGGCVVHGMLLASLLSQIVGMHLPGKNALYLSQELSFRKPVLVGEPVRAIARVVSKIEATRTLQLATEIRNREDKVVVSGTGKVKVLDNSPAAARPSPAAILEPEKPLASVPVAIVTGATGGVGSAIARELAARGFAIGINYFRNTAAAQRLAGDIAGKNGRAAVLQADVRDVSAVEDMLARAVSELGNVTAVVNCAAGEPGEHELATATWAEFDAQLDYHVKGVLQVCQAAYPGLKVAGHGSIVNVLSQVVDQPPARMAAYVTAKFALEGLSKAMAAEWAASKVRVNMVSPGLMQTDMTQHYPERLFKLESTRTPLRRIADPSDVARAVAFLLSDSASFITGVNLSVTGGQVMK